MGVERLDHQANLFGLVGAGCPVSGERKANLVVAFQPVYSSVRASRVARKCVLRPYALREILPIFYYTGRRDFPLYSRLRRFGNKFVTDAEFAQWLRTEAENGRMTFEQMRDLLDQKALFDRAVSGERDFLLGRLIGYVGGQRLESSDIHSLVDAAKRSFPSRMLYFEAIGFDLS